ncbi:hypothetical protein D3C79_34790 [compost metagenome]
MKIIPIEQHGDQQRICLPEGMKFDGITSLEIDKAGDIIIIRPARLHWSLGNKANEEPA